MLCRNFINSRKYILLQQLKLGFERTTNWNKYQTEITI